MTDSLRLPSYKLKKSFQYEQTTNLKIIMIIDTYKYQDNNKEK